MALGIPQTWHDGQQRKRHLVDILEDDDNILVASKFWSKRKQRWKYCLETEYEVKQLHLNLTGKNK